jgi:hypothetical protein
MHHLGGGIVGLAKGERHDKTGDYGAASAYERAPRNVPEIRDNGACRVIGLGLGRRGGRCGRPHVIRAAGDDHHDESETYEPPYFHWDPPSPEDFVVPKAGGLQSVERSQRRR